MGAPFLCQLMSKHVASVNGPFIHVFLHVPLSMTSIKENIRDRAAELALTEQIQQGNVEAFSKLYDSYSSVLHGVILKITNDKKAAEDILQKACLQVWTEIISFDPSKGSLLMWMLSITRSMALTAVSKKVEADEIQPADNSVNTINPESTPLKTNTVIETPPLEQNSILELLYFKGYSLTQAANELDTSVAELKTRLRMEFKLQGAIKSNE